MSSTPTVSDTQRRLLLQSLTMGGAVLAATSTVAAAGQTSSELSDKTLQDHLTVNHRHKFLIGPMEVDVNINDDTKIAEISLHPFFSKTMAFMQLTLSESKGILDIKRGFHFPELGWGGEMECGIDFAEHRFATHIELETPFGNFKKGPILQWS